jgi:hypothetical protein
MLAEQLDGVTGVDTHRDTLGAAAVSPMDALVDLPPMVIADLLGIHPKTAERWATLADGNWSEYLAARRAAPQS